MMHESIKMTNELLLLVFEFKEICYLKCPAKYFFQKLKSGLHTSSKNLEHVFANTFCELSAYALLVI